MPYEKKYHPATKLLPDLVNRPLLVCRLTTCRSDTISPRSRERKVWYLRIGWLPKLIATSQRKTTKDSAPVEIWCSKGTKENNWFNLLKLSRFAVFVVAVVVLRALRVTDGRWSVRFPFKAQSVFFVSAIFRIRLTFTQIEFWSRLWVIR